MSSSVPDTPTCILGLGLIGGSLLRDLVEAGAPAYGWNRPGGTARGAKADGYDVSTDLAETLKRANDDYALIVIAVPMPAVPAMLDAILEHAPNCTITDVVSVKQPVFEEVRKRRMAGRYVGSHPMAGTADSGWHATMNGLFAGAVWVVTFDFADEARRAGMRAGQRWLTAFRQVIQLGTTVGSEIIPSRARYHDQAVARISHLPHLLAEALAAVGDNGGALALSLAAGSFRDATRVAGTSPKLVRAMCESNSTALLGALDEAMDLLAATRAELEENGSVKNLVTAGHISRMRYEVRSGRHNDPGLSKEIAAHTHRPVIRVNFEQPDYVAQLEHAEHLGARLEIF
ncbi:prephenate dehydrogenase [Corynebacterium sp. TAE3-ERU12]|uniref:prephenate dehydrogenase n=1 Tax=Corynebacterium sp. TAE3-ERU12 TaxID=2849491 RepID=UPI001C48FCF0|nr:prephenate dehydrogenase [Corynebacterium sp. TAE3-ERU12]MBV7294424.1 prephenate dehydrogenase [Corynebacterium sp. TAE3-ERU12]